MTHYPGTIRAQESARLALIKRTEFTEMLYRIPQLGGRLVGIMADRIRESTKSEQQRDRLMALGRLSAGLAHEINNPASAASRAAEHLRETLEALQSANLRLDRRSLTAEQRIVITNLEEDAIRLLPEAPKLDSLEASDREEELGTWLQGHGVSRAWEHAPLMVESGMTVTSLELLSERIDEAVLNDAFARVTATVTASRLAREIQHSIERITDLVSAIKDYSYMDQAPEQEVDVHDGIESTLTIMAYKLRKNNVEVTRYFSSTLPRICAFGRELNQVWTNVIDNAADAMKDGGNLLLSTSFERQRIVVDIQDNGPGIPPELKERIFEPFFTTKDVGQGTGLGLDTVARIVKKHRGEIRIDSKPGETHFRVYLPAIAPPDQS
jgi:signal transduction histidine kinase